MYLFCCFPANLYSESTGLFLTFHTEKFILKVNKGEITRENAFNGGLFETEYDHESSKDEKTWFQVFLQICYPCSNPWAAKYIYLQFSSIACFEISRPFPEGLESLDKAQLIQH